VTADPVLRAADLRRQGEGLRALRKRAGRTQTEVAAGLGLATETYRLYERGVSSLDFGRVRAFAKALGATTPELVEACGLLEATVPEEAEWNPRAILEAEGVSARKAEQILGDLHGRGIETQRAVIEAALMIHREEVAAGEAEAPKGRDEASA
jgi:transcriptional regulator with XRE-family HTH domain